MRSTEIWLLWLGVILAWLTLVLPLLHGLWLRGLMILRRQRRRLLLALEDSVSSLIGFESSPPNGQQGIR